MESAGEGMIFPVGERLETGEQLSRERFRKSRWRTYTGHRHFKARVFASIFQSLRLIPPGSA
jgi:hypothetical protein